MSDPEISVSFSKVNLRLDRIPPTAREGLLATITIEAEEVRAIAQSKASGDRLQVQSGKFVRSIKAGVRQSANRILGRIYSRDPRAGLFEYGGHTPAHTIMPKNAHALLLQVHGGDVFAAVVHHPGGKYDARYILHSAFGEKKSEIKSEMTAAVLRAVPPAS